MKTLLIVEDNEHNMELMIQLLEDDYKLILARDGLEALDELVDKTPDLILMDLSMPRMDGWTTIREIRKGSTCPGIPIIALTAHAMHGEKERAVKAGADDFITKPIDFDRLFDTIELLIE